MSETARDLETAVEPDEPSASWGNWADTASFWLLIATLAWAPFPLGSNRPWSWSMLMLLIVLCWLLWAVPAWNETEKVLRQVRRLAGPIVLASLALLLGVMQILSFVPVDWIHPVWLLGSDITSHTAQPAISLNPWRTNTELMKLLAYAMVTWLAYVHARITDRAERLLNSVIAIGAAYALYALLLGMAGYTQYEFFYLTPPLSGYLSGPFVLHNSFATYVGVATLCAIAKFYVQAEKAIVVGREIRQAFLTALHFVFGSGVWPLLAVALSFSMVIASASRAGFLAMLVGLGVLVALSGMVAAKRRTGRWAILGASGIGVCVLVLFLINGDTLQARFDQITDGVETDEIRLAMWSAASRMAADAHWLGLGLGTYENAYPMYSDRVMPWIVDKAHNDYLEIGAGWGLPAALLWNSAITWLAALCLLGLYTRKRNRIYPLVACSATALVAFHSFFDFSLQLPAVALTSAAVLGMGTAQSFGTRRAG